MMARHAPMVQSVRNLLDRGFHLEAVGSDDDWLFLRMRDGDVQHTVQLDREATRQLLASPILDRLAGGPAV